MYVDISASDCGAPFSKLAEALEVLEDGKVLMAVMQKEASASDVQSYCQQMNLELVGQGEDGEQFYFLIRK